MLWEYMFIFQQNNTVQLQMDWKHEIKDLVQGNLKKKMYVNRNMFWEEFWVDL